MGYIYKITNKTDGKIYIGQTIQPLDERFRQHRKKGSNCRYLHLFSLKTPILERFHQRKVTLPCAF